MRDDNHTFKNLPSNTDLLGFDQALISKTSEEISNFPCFLFSPLSAPAPPLLPALVFLSFFFCSAFFLASQASLCTSLKTNLHQKNPPQSFSLKSRISLPLLQQRSLTVPLQKPPTILCLPLLSEIFLLPKTPKNPPSQKRVTLLLSNHPTLSNSLALSQTPPIKSSLLRFSLSCPPRLQEKF